MNAQEYGQLFFSTIGKAPGMPADDYEAVMGGSGIPKGYGPWVVPTADMPFHAMTQQIGSDGRIAGRIFLPTASPDPNGYFTHPYSPLADAPAGSPHSLVYEWRDLGGPPIVDPSDGSSSGGGDTGGGGGGLTEAQVQSMIDASIAPLQEQIAAAVKIGDKVALRSAGDSGAGIPASLVSVDGGGPKQNGQPMTFQGRTGAQAGPWESLTVERGQ